MSALSTRRAAELRKMAFRAVVARERMQIPRALYDAIRGDDDREICNEVYRAIVAGVQFPDALTNAMAHLRVARTVGAVADAVDAVVTAARWLDEAIVSDETPSPSVSAP